MDAVYQMGKKRRLVRDHKDAPCPKRRRLEDLSTLVKKWNTTKRSSVDVLLGRFVTV